MNQKMKSVVESKMQTDQQIEINITMLLIFWLINSPWKYPSIRNTL